MTWLNCDLSFDPADPYFQLWDDGHGGEGIEWAVQVFTPANGYGLDASTSTAETVDGACVRTTTGFARLGQQQAAGSGRVVVAVRRDGPRWTFDIDAEHDEPIKSVKLILRGLPAEDLSSGWWSPTTPRGQVAVSPFQWNYPGSEWATRWAAAGRVALSIDAPDVSGAVLRVAAPPYAPGPEVELVHAVLATQWSTRVSVPTIHLLVGANSSDAAADFARHHRAVRRAFGIGGWSERRDVPDWARRLELVVTLHGQHWTGHVFHTFDDMARLLRLVAEEVDPTTVLAYLPGWEGRYYHDYPVYQPGRDLGGDDGFARLVEAAHGLGFRLMPMFGAHGANVERYPAWERSTLRNPTDRYPVMLNAPDWDGDRYPEGNQVFLNPGEPVFRRDLVNAVSGTVERFGVDAAFFDTAGFWFDDPRFAVVDGLRAIAESLHERFPQLLLAAEGWWDALTAIFPLSQQWLGVERDIRRPELVTESARTTAHLAEGAPGHGSTGVHELGFRPGRAAEWLPGHLPVVSFAGGTGAEQRDTLRRWAGRLRSRSGATG